jgi:hypothetical protein
MCSDSKLQVRIRKGGMAARFVSALTDGPPVSSHIRVGGSTR